MKNLFTILLFIALSQSPAYAESSTDKIFTPPDESQLVEHHNYSNSKHHSVHSPAQSKNGLAPSGASAKCRDDTYSFSQSRRGTCSHHGGVAEWL